MKSQTYWKGLNKKRLIKVENDFQEIPLAFPQAFGKKPVHLRLQSTMAERVSSRAPHRDVGSQVRVSEEGAEAEDRFDAGRQVQM